jgi:hypothetical protein
MMPKRSNAGAREMAAHKKNKRYSLASRLLAMMACMALVVIGLTWWLAGFSLMLAAGATVALAALLGPAVVEGGGGVLEFLSGLLELIGEMLSTLMDAICSIFSSFG